MTLNQNKGTNRRITVMLLVMLLIMSIFAFPAAASGEAEVKIDTENADKATVCVNGAETQALSFKSGEEFNLEVKVGDIVEIGFNSGAVKFRILEIKETVRKEDAEKLYEILAE